jgi:hypothetical protein
VIFARTAQLLLGLLLLHSAAAAQIPGTTPQSPVTFGGYLKLLSTVQYPQTGEKLYDQTLHQRFNFEYRFPANVKFTTGIRNRLFYGQTVRTPGYDKLIGSDAGYLDLSWNWLQRGQTLGNTSLDRIYLDWKPGNNQIRLGRHRIAWGMTTLWNPNDLFNTYSIYDIDYAERPGTDALLLGTTLGFASSLETVWAFADDWDSTSLATRYQFNHNGYDIQLLAGKNRIDLVGGVGFAGTIIGAGLRGEISYFAPYRKQRHGLSTHRSTVATLEIDHTLPGKRNSMVKLATLYISNPDSPGNGQSYLAQPLTARSLSFTRWTGYADFSIDITPLSRQSLSGSYYDDGSWYLLASNAVSLLDDWELMIVWQRFDGRSGSLFGSNPSDLLFGRLRWSF